MNTIEMIEVLGGKYQVRIEQWKDGSTSWRVGLDWFDGDDYMYVCEGKSLDEAVKMAYEYHRDVISV